MGKEFKPAIGKALIMVLISTVLCGIIYPLFVTGIAQLFFHDKANGSIIEKNGVAYGSELLSQNFTKDEYLWGRVTLPNTGTYTDDEGKPLYYAGPSNLSPAGEAFGTLIEERTARMRAANPDADMEKVPVDLVTCSGSGLDPEISVKAAKYQIPRLAKARGMSEEEVKAVIDRYTSHRFLGVLGEETVNVLKVNLALDGILEERINRDGIS